MTRLLKSCKAELGFKASKRVSDSIISSLMPEIKKDKGEISATPEGFKIVLSHAEVGRLRALVGSYLRLVNSTMKVLQRE
jgi:tRNA threonylcarbamoyladenosine modification (KEOPS) complex  Pcc1 subunit